jgi:hypothetical protein
MSECAATIPNLTETNWITWNTQQATHLHQLALWNVITKEHTTSALELHQAGTNKDGMTIPLTTDQKALNICIWLDNNTAAERFCSTHKSASGNIFAHLSQLQCTHVQGIEDNPIAM